MGRLLLIYRLVVGDIRRRPVESVLLLLLVVVTTAATLALGLALRQVAHSPFARTKAATRGPDIAVQGQPHPGSRLQLTHAGEMEGLRTPAGAFTRLGHAAGVAAIGGPFPLAFVHLTASHIDVAVNAEGRTRVPSAVNQPLVTVGHWVRPRGVVLEQGLAGVLGLRVGDRIRLRGQSFTVVGVALQTEQAFYPACTPGLVWVTPADSTRLSTRSDPLGYAFDIKLTHPSATDAFYNSAAFNTFNNALIDSSISRAWTANRQDDYRVVTIDQKALLIGGWLLGMLAIASSAVLVGGRLAEQTRRVGLLKAVGATPRLVAAVLVAENLVIALAGAAAGLLVAWPLIPAFADPGRGLLGTPPSPPLTLSSIAEVVLAGVVVATAATVPPALRGARTSTIKALNDLARPPQRRARVIALSAWLPVPMLLGVRLISRRLRRTLLTSASLTIAVTMIIAAITLQSEVHLREQPPNGNGLVDWSSSIGGRVTHLVWILGVVLVVLAGLTAIFTTWATVIDAERPTALARALGATPRQVSTALTAAQLLPGLIAACVGIPAGLGLYQLAGGQVATANPSIPLLLAVLPCTLAAVAAFTYLPARAGARRSVAEVLRSE